MAHHQTTGTAAPARDIRIAPQGRDILTDVAAGQSGLVMGQLPLPTPPNSVSPPYPVSGLKARLQRALPDAVDTESDLDIRDGNESDSNGSLAFESTGDITPGLLAKYHLPDILLNHGPLAIRHITGHLTASVPGFSSIPPPKARRLVVAALEGRGPGNRGEGGGLNGDVEYEKVSWGRWAARRRISSSTGTGLSGVAVSRKSPGANFRPAPHGGVTITKRVTRNHTDRSYPTARSRRRSHANSPVFSHDNGEIGVVEYEADKMSLDSLDASGSRAEAHDGDVMQLDDDSEATDEEDWGAIGAAALRASSYDYPARNFRRIHKPEDSHSFASSGILQEPRMNKADQSTLEQASPNTQEREAIQALLQLGSV